MQTCRPDALVKVLALHAGQSRCWPLRLLARPLSHGKQNCAPTSFWYFPAPQASQLFCPELGWYRPAAQSAQTVTLVVALVVVWRPEGHSVHLDWPSAPNV